MKIKKRIIEIYNDDFRKLMEGLSHLSKEERMSLFEVHSRMLFPKSKMVINLEDQLKGHKDYLHKFKKCFFIIGNDFFSVNHFGEYNQERFIEKTGFKSQRYPQKVILSLSLMGYVKGMKCNYSTSNHGYVYEVDYLKYRNWNQDFNEGYEEVILDGEVGPREWTETENEWLLEKQLNTIRSISVDKEVFQEMMKKKDDFLSNSTRASDNQKELDHLYDMESLYYRTDASMKFKVDGSSGRFYSVMTRLKSDYRVNGTVQINGESFCEVDVASSQPTLLGVILKKDHPDVQSRWLDHCLSGDFYEWIVDITGMEDYSVDQLVNELLKITCISGNDNPSLKRMIENNRKMVEKVSEIKSDDKHEVFRPVVKNWIMRFLFSKFKMSSTEQDGHTIYKHFCYNLCTYLKEQEPCLYEMLCWYRSKENHVPKRKDPGKTTSELPSKLQQEEVRYIKRCLKNMDKEVEYLYTVHDCIGCLVSDAEKVKEIMERTAMEMYGVKLELKIEKGDEWEVSLW